MQDVVHGLQKLDVGDLGPAWRRTSWSRENTPQVLGRPIATDQSSPRILCQVLISTDVMLGSMLARILLSLI